MESKWCLVYSHDAVVAKLDELVGRDCRRITHCPDSYNTNGDVNSWFITYIEPEIKHPIHVAEFFEPSIHTYN